MTETWVFILTKSWVVSSHSLLSVKLSHLKRPNGSTLEAKICLEVLGNFTNKPLEGKLPDQELCRLLVTTNFPKSYGTRLVTVRLLYSTSRWGALPGSLGGKLLPWGLSTSRLTSCLLGTSHALFRFRKTRDHLLTSAQQKFIREFIFFPVKIFRTAHLIGQ